MILKLRRFSTLGLNNERNQGFELPTTQKPQKQKKLNTSGGMVGFNKDRDYDQDFNRLGRFETTRQLSQTRLLQDEMRKLSKELNEGRRGKWLDT